MVEPSTLYPEITLQSGLVSVHQSLGSTVDIGVDVLRTERDRRFCPYNTRLLSYYNRMTPASKATLVSPRLEWLLPIPEPIEAFLTHKWQPELDYRLIKEIWDCRENCIAVRFAHEWCDDSGNWFRSYGNENWEFDERGLMRRRLASINDAPIRETERKYFWPLGRRPDEHPSLSELGF